MKAATLFSGIGAPEQARPDWQWLWHAEIEPFPAAVMAARHPGSINLGDVTADDFAQRAERIGRPDVLVFGSPCQSFSVAGQRAGLACPRGNLALVALALVRRLRPSWFVFENVPGLLSSEGGDDFETFLAAVAESRYSGCWRVLDARYWHLAQRRERVFFVGSLGDWRGPAAVLSFSEGMRGYPEKGSQSWQRVARPIAACPAGGSGYRNDADTADNLIAADLAPPVTSNPYGDHESRDGLLVAYGGNNTAGPIDIATAVNAHGGPCGRMDFETETFVAQAFHWQSGGDMRGIELRDTSMALSCEQTPAVAFKTQQTGANGPNWWIERTHTLGSQEQPPAVAHAMQVRRLTPRECERLQGFPDDFTAIAWRGKPAADGPRYRAIGNSMAVPVLRWLLTRIEAHQQQQELSACA